MIKKFSVSLMIAGLAATGFAAEDRISVASIDKTLPHGVKNAVLQPVVTEKYEYYEVCGCSEKELQCDLKQKCFSWNNGKKYDSLTLWDVKWDHGYDRAPQACSTDSFRVTVDIIFRYPKWARADDVPRPLVEKWERYLQNLVIHENGHRDIVVKAANELSQSVAEFPPAPTCAELDRKVRAMCRERMQKMNDDQKVYDEATGHGVTQGAAFP